jgi:hypothetical protein
VTAGSFTIGNDYTILTTGTTDFTLIGAADSNPGTKFTATGAGSGTGTAAEHPSGVTFGTRALKLVALSRTTETNSTLTTEKWRGVIGGSNSRTPTITWPSNLNARACYCTEIDGAGPKDVGSRNAQTSTTNPTTGTAVTTTKAETYHSCAFGSNGPSGDTVGTVGQGHTSGQRAGTTGGAAATNVTIHETYELLSSVGDCRSAKTGTTARRWANSITAYSAMEEYRASMGSSDLDDMRGIFDGSTLDHEDMIFHWNSDENRWEVYDWSDDSLIAYYETGTGWVEI